MLCQKCGYVTPYDKRPDGDACFACAAKLTLSSEDWLSVQSLGLVRELRPGQLRIANTIETALRRTEEHTVTLAQGGCGIGKSFAYLVPTILQKNERVVVSTAKKSLQGQLATKDLPFLHQTMGLPRDFVSVKGRSNYACKLLLLKRQKDFKNKQLHSDLMEFLRENEHGDLDQFSGGTTYPANTCTAVECVGRSCRYATDCGYRKAKGHAHIAQVVVVNHSLLGFDLRFGPKRLMGEYDTLVIDEVHAAEDSFRTAFSSELRSTWPAKLFKDIAHNNIVTSLGQPEIEKPWRAMFDVVTSNDKALPPNFLKDTAPAAVAALTKLAQQVRAHIRTQWGGLADNLSNPLETDEILGCIHNEEERTDASIAIGVWKNITETMTVVGKTEEDDANYVRVREQAPNGTVKFIMKPIDVGRLVGPALRQIANVILTSATLQDKSIQRELGVTATYTINEPSPFDFKRNGLLYMPKHLPNPSLVGVGKPTSTEDYYSAIAAEIVKLARASNGNGLVLFTSLKEMADIHQVILRDHDLKQPIFAQMGGRRADEVFQEFMATPNSLLFGSKSFFEGIDVQGEKLRLVVLTKLPFPMFGDAIVQAKQAQMGEEYFSQFYLPKMFTDLQQAAGRLIRTQFDRGVFAILDTRIWVAGNKKVDPLTLTVAGGYGGTALRQLPFTNRTADFAFVDKFLKHIQA